MGLPDGLKLFADDREISDDFPAIEFGWFTETGDNRWISVETHREIRYHAEQQTGSAEA